MSLDVWLTATVPTEVFAGNITTNLGDMAEEAGIYRCLWRPDELGITRAWELAEPLRAGLALLRADPKRFEALNPPSGWGTYEDLVAFVEGYLIACSEYPLAEIFVSR
jgi:hypothetical protein